MLGGLDEADRDAGEDEADGEKRDRGPGERQSDVRRAEAGDADRSTSRVPRRSPRCPPGTLARLAARL